MAEDYKFFSGSNKVLVQDNKNHIKEAEKPKFTKKEIQERIDKFTPQVKKHEDYVEVLQRYREMLKEYIKNNIDKKGLTLDTCKKIVQEKDLEDKIFMQKKIWYDIEKVFR